MAFNWSHATVGEFVDLQRGNTYRSELLDRPGPVLLGLASIERDGGFRSDKLRTYGGDSPSKLLVYPGDLYVSLKDVTQSGDLLGSVARVPESVVVGRMTQDTVKLIFKSDLIKKSYLYWVLRTPEYREYCRSRSMGTTNLSMSRDDFLSFPVPEPSSSRSLLVEVLDDIEVKVSANRRINQTLEAMAQALFKSWFVDFDPVRAQLAAKAEGRDPLRAAMTAISGKPDANLDILPPDQFASLSAIAALFPDEMEASEVGEMPKGWHPSTLTDECTYLNRGISPKYVDAGGVLVLNQKCIRDFSVDTSKGRRHDPNQRTVSGRELQKGDVLVNSTGVGTLGRVAQVLRLEEPTIVDSHVTVVRTGANLNSAYLGQWFVSKQPDIEAMGEGSTGQTELSRGKLASMSILVPKHAVLEAFAAAVAPMQSLIIERSRESLVLQRIRDALLPRFISGELQPTVALEGIEA